MLLFTCSHNVHKFISTRHLTVLVTSGINGSIKNRNTESNDERKSDLKNRTVLRHFFT